MQLGVSNNIAFSGVKQLKTKPENVNNTEIKQPEAPAKVKAGVMATTLLGVATATAIGMKKNGFSINPKNIIKDFKNSGLMKMDYDFKNIIRIASGSVGGGLLGGAIFDKKENMPAKIREATIQMFANILIPLGTVAGGTKLFDKYAKTPLLKLLKQVTPDGKIKTNGMAAKWMNVGVTALTLIGAIFAGNKATNLVNEKVYNIKDDRDVKLADMSGHIDDTCLAISTGFGPNNPVTKFVSRVIPAALMVCGYSTGIMQEWPDDIKNSRKANPNKPFRL